MSASDAPKLKTLDDLPVDGKRVLVRVDFNVSIGSDGRVDQFEDYRLEAALPTINELRQRRCKILLLTHYGRPQEDKGSLSLTPIRQRLEELLGEEVTETRKMAGPEVDSVLAGLEAGSVVLLPNVRMDSREELGNEKFAEELASSAEVFVNEAFSVCHRAHTSVAFVPHFLPSCAGRRTVLEVQVLDKLREHPDAPYVAIASGAKISDKVGILRDLLNKVDTLCLGGQIANVFLAGKGELKEHYYSEDDMAVARHLLQEHGDKIMLPIDVIVGPAEGGAVETLTPDAVPPLPACACDIGPSSVERILAACQGARTILWNGPVGKFELPEYAKATEALARALAVLPAYRVVGGGDTVNALERLHLIDKFDHVSIGGGALVEFMEGKRLPGLVPLYTQAEEV